MSSTLGMTELGDAAIASMPAMPVAPRIRIERTDNGWTFACPYRKADHPRWEAMLFQAFGTRSISVMEHFLSAISDLIGNDSWDEEKRIWMPLERDFQAAVNIINALQPENEAQAAYAAQLLALHLSSMKLGARAAKGRYGDERTSAILAKTSRAFGDGMERLARLQGKTQPKTVTQIIEVVYVDQRDQQSVQVGGVRSNGGQPHGANASAPLPCATLPSPRQNNGQLLSLSGCEDKARLPHTWWGSRLWSTFWRAER